MEKGHDVLMYPKPLPAFEDLVIDHRDIYDECELRHGKTIDLAVKSTYNPKTKKYFGFSPSFIPCPTNYRKDLWDEAGVFPDTWEDVRIGGRKIKQKHGIPVWISLSSRQLHTMLVRSIMYSFGASVQDEEGNVILNSRQTLESVKFFKALYDEAMTEEAVSWDSLVDDVSDQFIVSGKASLLLSSISATRTAERDNPDMSQKIQLAKTPKGTIRRMGQYYIPVYHIWKCADNIEGAQQFLIDYVGNFRKAFVAGKFRDFPCFPDTVPDLQKLIANDSRGHPPTKYSILKDALDWTANMGYPGYANAAIEEVESGHILPAMFLDAATGRVKAQDAIKDAEAECKRIFSGWRAKGRI